MVDVHDALHRAPRGSAQARPRARGAARADEQLAERSTRAQRADPARSWRCCSPTPRSTCTPSCSTPTCPRTRTCRPSSTRYFPHPLPERFGDADARAPPAARDHRHAGRQQHGSTAAARRSPSACTRRRARPPRRSRAPTPSARDVFAHAPAVGARSRRSTTRSPPTCRSRCCSRAAGWSSAARAGCCATAAVRSTSPRRSSTSPPARDGALRGRSRGCSARPTSSRWPADADELRAAGVPAALARARRRRWPRCSRRSTSSRWRTRRALDVEEVAAVHFRLGSGSSCTGCATASSRSRATTAGARWRAPRCATTSTRSTASSPPRCCATRAEGVDRRARRRLGGAQPGGRALPADAGRHPRRPRLRH